MMELAVGYIRVSTGQQVKSGLSLESQREKITQYCALHGLSLQLILEDHVSGSRADNRPGLQRLMELVRRKLVQHVVVFRLDRFARNTIETLSLVETITKGGAKFHSVHEHIDTSTPAGEFFLTVLAALAQMERRTISDRTRDALAAKRARGERLGGFRRFGYDILGQQEIPNEREQAIIEEIRNRRGAGETLGEIARDLNDRGITAAAGGRWYSQTVQRVL